MVTGTVRHIASRRALGKLFTYEHSIRKDDTLVTNSGLQGEVNRMAHLSALSFQFRIQEPAQNAQYFGKISDNQYSTPLAYSGGALPK